MKFLPERFIHFQGILKSSGLTSIVDVLQVQASDFQVRVRSIRYKELPKIFIESLRKIISSVKSMGFRGTMEYSWQNTLQFIDKIKYIGFTENMEEYEKRKLGIFNQLNFFGFISGMIVPISGIFNGHSLPAFAWFVACCPAFISILVLWLNHNRRYESAVISYFILYPVVTSMVYLGGLNLGIDLFFILYGILSVFFLHRVSHMLFSVSLSMISYFMLAVVLKNYNFQLESANLAFYLFNQLLAIVFIFYGLYLIKTENTGYQFSILNKNRELHRVNLEIEKQKTEIANKATQLEEQTIQLTELNSLKNKLFSVISHDLKTPMYALRNLFRNVQSQDLSGEEIKSFIPDVVNDINYTTGLMENLLQWAKSQMQADLAHPQVMDMSELIDDVFHLLRLQAEAKKIYIEHKLSQSVLVYADKDMVHLVLRNLLSNAIKFTPEQGNILVGAAENHGFVEVYVKDSGLGISPENIDRLFKEYYTSKGTANESGTGLGLMLCKEFLAKNGGRLHVESEEGKGSVFSFTLPKAG